MHRFFSRTQPFASGNELSVPRSFLVPANFVCLLRRLNLNSLLETEDSCVSSQGTQIEALSDQSGDTEVKTSCQMLLFEAYRSIGEPDAVYGVGTVYLPDVATRVKAYEYEQEFGKALRESIAKQLHQQG